MGNEESTGQDKKESLKYFKVAESPCGCHDNPQLHVLGIFVNGGMLPDTLYRAIADMFRSECVQLPDGPYAAFVNAPDGKKTDTEDFGTIDRNLINSLMLKTEDQRKEEKQQEAQSREERERNIMLSIKTWRKMHNLREQDPEPNNENNRNNKQVDIELDQTEVRMMEEEVIRISRMMDGALQEAAREAVRSGKADQVLQESMQPKSMRLDWALKGYFAPYCELQFDMEKIKIELSEQTNL